MPQIRPAEIRDALGIAKVHAQSWLDTYSGVVPPTAFETLTLEKRAETWTANLSRPDNPTSTLVAVDSRGEIVGFVKVGPARLAEFFGVGEIYAIYLDQRFHGKGIGAALFFAGMKEIKDMGYHSAYAVALTDNPKRDFYKKVGGAVHGHVTTPICGEEVPSTVYYWPHIPEERPNFKKVSPTRWPEPTL